MVKFSKAIKRLMPLTGEKKETSQWVSNFVETGMDDFNYLLKQDRVSVEEKTYGSEKLDVQKKYPYIEPAEEDPEVESICEKWNEEIEGNVRDEAFREFANKADEKIQETIAPNIVGMDLVKQAVMLQLFSKERLHILLLGDPGTGKTDILRSAANLSPKSSFGLGSGTSGAGLTLTVKGKEVLKGLLPRANKGLCCIDELNLMKNRDRAGLLNAMEKGFVTYDKGNYHHKEDADVRVLSTANPEGDEFAGWMIDTLKKQIPFDSALLTRFHLVFLIRKPDVEGFKEITKKIVSEKEDEQEESMDEEESFIQDYIQHAAGLNVQFDNKLEPLITDFAEELKKNEDEYLIDISPRIVVGLMRLAKARSRLFLREKVTREDVNEVLDLMKQSLKIKKKEEDKKE